MSDACNRTFPEIFSEQLPISFYKPFDPEEGLLATVVSTIFSAVPVFGELGEIATKATIKEIEIFWSGVGSTASAIAADSVSPETTITTDLVQALLSTAVEYRVGIFVARLVGQGLLTSVASGPILAALEVAIPVIVGIAVAYVTLALADTFNEAIKKYLNQPDQIYEITTADATDGTITINGVTAPIAEGIRDGVDVRHLVATPNAVGPNSTIKVDLYGLSNGALYQLNLDCADGLKLSNVSDTLDVSKVDLTNLQSWRFLDDQFIIDMAGGIDTVRYAATPIQTRGGIQGTNGIFYYDGATHAAGGGLGGGQNILGITSTNAMLTLLVAESLLPDDDLIVKGAENIVLTAENDRFVFTGQDMSVHSGYGKISGGGGGDIIVFNGAKAGPGGLGLEIDGGTGNDWLYVMGGAKATVIGGKGRDYIYNNTVGGVIYGDTVDGVGAGDSAANADKIVVTRGVTLMDAGTYDQLVMSFAQSRKDTKMTANDNELALVEMAA